MCIRIYRTKTIEQYAKLPYSISHKTNLNQIKTHNTKFEVEFSEMKLSASILALALSSFSIAQAIDPSLSMVPEVPMSNPPPPEDDDNEDRFIVKYVSGRRRAATRRLQEAGEIVMSLPKDDAEVVILHSQDEVKNLEASPDVVRVEKGMCCVHAGITRLEFSSPVQVLMLDS